MNCFKAKLILLVPLLIALHTADSYETELSHSWSTASEVRPPAAAEVHSVGNVGMAVYNLGIFGDPWENYFSLDWPLATENGYLWCGDIWSCCYGNVTPGDSAARYASCSDYGKWELRPGEGWPLLYETPGSIAPEQSEYGADDWCEPENSEPYGIGFFVRTMTWDDTGYDNLVFEDIIVTHHSEHGNPGVPLDGLVVAIRGDCDIASADPNDKHLDDMVYYDGHAIWCNDAGATFEYIFDGSVPASTQDEYTWQQNPDNPLPSGDPDNIWYYYNYKGSDGIPDNDVDQDGVSDHFTVLARVAGTDTLYRTDPVSGVTLFEEGMPSWHWNHVVGDTTYLVVPRNLSYMWDGDGPGSAEDDSGEPLLATYCNGFVGWRLLDVWVSKAGGGIERPCDVLGCPVPISHQWWNWESDPGTDPEKYFFMWGINPDYSGLYSGPGFMCDWLGNPNAPDAVSPSNAGPFPFVYDNPINLDYPVFDYRFLQSIGPLELADGDTLHIVGGWVMGLGLDGLRMNADLLLDAYYRGSIWGEGLGIEGSTPAVSPGVGVSPNPMTASGVVDFTLARPGRTEIGIFDLSGRLVANPLDADLAAGRHSVEVDASGLDCGVYFVRVLSGDGCATGRFVVLR
mgnify:FL=1